jgi:hypothetical protein
MKTAAVFVLVLAGLLVGTAHAEAAGEEPSVAVPLDFPIMRGALEVAEEFWATRGITPPPLAGVYELPNDSLYAEDAGYGELPGDRIWIAGWVLEDLAHPIEPIMARATLCYLVTHERGHNAGLHHSDAGVFPIMGVPEEVGPSYWRRPTAPRCWVWAEHPLAPSRDRSG